MSKLERDNIIKEILKLKEEHPLTKETKIKIQKLQQKLDDLLL